MTASDRRPRHLVELDRAVSSALDLDAVLKEVIGAVLALRAS